MFKEKLGATDEDVADVPQMTQLARRVLRKAFLKADMGITGVNFGVAETGSVCICTNEGNGRLSTHAAARPRRDHGHGADRADGRRPRRDAARCSAAAAPGSA